MIPRRLRRGSVDACPSGPRSLVDSGREIQKDGLMRALAVAGGVWVALLFGVAQAQAATFTVTRTDDPVSATCSPSNCSLRAAIAQADSDGANDTVIIPAGDYKLTSAAGGDIAITATMTIAGAGARSVTIVPAPANSGLMISSGTVVISGVTFAGSTNANSGGGIYATGTTALTLNNDRFTNNGVSGSTDGGGLLDNSTAPVTINASLFDSNQGYNGAAAYLSAPARVINSTFIDNSGGNTSRNGDGGALLIDTGTLVNDTFTGNECFNGSGCGGAIRATSVSIADTIVAGNLAYAPGPDTTSTDNCSINAITVTGPDLENGTTCTGFTVHGDPRLGPLQDNGGSTDTLALTPGSPALGAGTNSSCAAVDQRGVGRPQASRCDIGAFEFQAPKISGNPTLSGTARPGQKLTCGAAAVLSPDGPATTSVTVVRDGAPVPSGATYTVVPGDVGHTLACVQIATNVVASVNAASAGVKVQSIPGISLNSKSVKIGKRGTGKLSVVCAATSAVSCQVSGGLYGPGKLATIAKNAKKVGGVSGTIAAGQTGKLTIKLTRAELARLKAKHHLTVRLLVKVTDTAGATTTLRATITLTLKK
jgi:hypothetical protein